MKEAQVLTTVGDPGMPADIRVLEFHKVCIVMFEESACTAVLWWKRKGASAGVLDL